MFHRWCYFRLLAVLHSPPLLEGSYWDMNLPLQCRSQASVRFRPHPCHRHRPLPHTKRQQPASGHTRETPRRNHHNKYNKHLAHLLHLIPIPKTSWEKQKTK
uniref:Putative secreted protein n=1 Tax=Anopheles triannulatus TaxID=58253 RepID=A0A2M4B3Z1_9DIPT